MLEHYLQMCFRIFGALGRESSEAELSEMRRRLAKLLTEAYASSSHSNAIITYEAPLGSTVKYEMSTEAVPLTAAYEHWLEVLAPPLFGEHADARVLSLAQQLGEPAANPVLDVGAGTGRNALELACRGHRVDAVELTPSLARILQEQVSRYELPVRVIASDFFRCGEQLGSDYRLVVLSGVVGDFRWAAELRTAFELASGMLAVGGQLVLSIHLVVPGYTPTQVEREWAQQCCATCFTRAELSRAAAGLDLELVQDESAHDYERRYSSEAAWPPTPSYAEWALGQHMYALPREQCPLELRWVTYRKCEGLGRPRAG